MKPLLHFLQDMVLTAPYRVVGGFAALFAPLLVAYYLAWCAGEIGWLLLFLGLTICLFAVYLAVIVPPSRYYLEISRRARAVRRIREGAAG